MGKFPETMARKFFCELMSGLKHCHSKGIAHRDIQLQNLLLDHNYNLKIADFGLAAKCDDGYLDDYCGTLSFAAPEILQ